MPNWVYTTMTAEGPKADVDRLVTSVSGVSDAGGEVPFTFQAVLPRPADRDDDWYDWNVANWGTKWDAVLDEAPFARESDGCVSLRFRTAWSYPEPVFVRLSSLFPTLAFTFDFEEEQGWGGSFEASAGSMRLTASYDVPASHADMVDRGAACFCEYDDPVFPDCWSAAARVCGVTDVGVLEMVEKMSENWSDDLSGLIAAAEAVQHPQTLGGVR